MNLGEAMEGARKKLENGAKIVVDGAQIMDNLGEPIEDGDDTELNP